MSRAPTLQQASKPAEDLVSECMRTFAMPSKIAQIICEKGFQTIDEIHDFLFPKLSDLPHPEGLKDIAKAVGLVLGAIKKKETILIHGDFDVDGITAVSLLSCFFREIGVHCEFYIPNRLKERYGPSMSSINALIEKGRLGAGGLVITVDCGISACDEIVYLKEKGYRVIITDHHEPPEKLPNADAIVNPKQSNCGFSFPWLSGVGVAFYLAIAIRSELVRKGFFTVKGEPNLKQLLDLVALGTVADVMPLIKTNRILVKAGLEVLSARVRPGIFALCETANAESGGITSEDIAYKLAPRINAAGRLGKPEVAVELFLATDLIEAKNTARKLEEMNTERKTLEQLVKDDIFRECDEQIQKKRKALAVYSPGCHPGIIGIIASRLVDTYGIPAIVFTNDKMDPKSPVLKGSGRSLNGINIFEALKSCQTGIEQYGGHAMAIGITIAREMHERFAKDFSDVISGLTPKKAVANQSKYFEAKGDEILTPIFYDRLQTLQPFGEENPEPVFLLKEVQLNTPKKIKGHLRFTLKQGHRHISGIGFYMADDFVKTEAPVNLACRLKLTSFRGREQQELHAVAITTP